MEDNLHYVKAVIKNYKNIKSRVVEIGGRSLAIIGGNNKGKSSIIQALRSISGSKYIPQQPVTEGEERGELEVTISGEINGQPESYKIETYFTPGNLKGTLKVYDKAGNKVDKSPRKVLDNLLGDLSFSVDTFLRESPSKQAKTLKELSGKSKEIDLVDISIIDTKKSISLEKSRFEEQETLLKNHGYSDADIEKYSKPHTPPIEEIEKKLADIGPAMEKYSKVEAGLADRRNKVETLAKDSGRLTEELEKNIAEIAKLQKRNEQIMSDKNVFLTEIETNTTQISKGEVWLLENIKPDNTKISQELTDAKMHNQHHGKLNEYIQKQKALIASKKKYASLKNDVEKLEKEKSDIIASSNLPIAGLTFSDEQVLFNGLPFERGQINTQTLLEVGEEICMSKYPTLKVIFVEEGSLYDKESLARLVDKAHKRGYQVIAEIVDPNGGELEIKFIEDYLA